jgi:hypothetical protein
VIWLGIVVLVALVLVHLTGLQWIDPVAAMLVASTILVTGIHLEPEDRVRPGERLSRAGSGTVATAER